MKRALAADLAGTVQGAKQLIASSTVTSSQRALVPRPISRRVRLTMLATSISPALYDEAKKNGWIIISMKNDWKKIFAFEP